VQQVIAVVEGRARAVIDPDVAGLRVLRAEQDGDTAMVAEAKALVAAAGDPARVLVVTADRGLRARLPLDCGAAGPRWLLICLQGSPHG
jgi:rRNA-processing protein FCF1